MYCNSPLVFDPLYLGVQALEVGGRGTWALELVDPQGDRCQPGGHRSHAGQKEDARDEEDGGEDQV